MQLLYSAQILSCELHDIRQCFVTIASYMLCRQNVESLIIYDFHSTLTRHFKIFYEHAVAYVDVREELPNNIMLSIGMLSKSYI